MYFEYHAGTFPIIQQEPSIQQATRNTTSGLEEYDPFSGKPPTNTVSATVSIVELTGIWSLMLSNVMFLRCGPSWLLICLKKKKAIRKEIETVSTYTV